MHRIFWAAVYSLDELSHVLAQCFTTGPLALAVAVEGMGAGVLLVTVEEEVGGGTRHGKRRE